MRFSPLLLVSLVAACGVSDADLDGFPDDVDAFPSDAGEHSDLDGDGTGDNGDAFPADPLSTVDIDGDGFGDGSDCDDTRGLVNPGATEVPYNGLDDDCDADTPDDDLDGDGALASADCDDSDANVILPVSGYLDADGDGFGDGNAQEICSADLPNTHALLDGDCDDDDTTRSPGAGEVPYDGIDQDCDDLDLWDADGDGHTAPGAPNGSADDCADALASIHPSATDIAGDNVDQDCSGDAFDADGDGDDDILGSDCDDADAAVGTHAVESFDNGIDDDCTEDTEDDNPDNDGDGYNSASAGGDDCDDTNASANPGQLELPDNGADDDCQDGDLVAADAGAVYVHSGHPSCVASGTTSPQAPACDLQDAVTDRSGDVLFIGGGPYAEVVLEGDLTVHGGYGTDWARDLGNPTEIASTSESGVIDVEGTGSTVMLSGLYISADTDNHGTGIYLDEGTLTVVDSTLDIRSNDSAFGLQVRDSSASLARVSITTVGNYRADGIVSDDSDVHLTDVQIDATTTLNTANGVQLDGGTASTFTSVDVVSRSYEGDAHGFDFDESGPVTMADVSIHVEFAGDTMVGIRAEATGDIDLDAVDIVLGTAVGTVIGIEMDEANLVQSNSSTVGGYSIDDTIVGIDIDLSSTTLEDCVIDLGDSRRDSVAVLASVDSSLRLLDSTVQGGASGGSFSAGVMAEGNLTVNRSTVSGGAASSSVAAGMVLEGPGPAVVANSLIRGGAGSEGIGLYTEGGTRHLGHNVILGGAATQVSGGLWIEDGTVVAVNNVVGSGYSDNESAALYVSFGGGGNVTLRNNGLWLQDDSADALDWDGIGFSNVEDIDDDTWRGDSESTFLADNRFIDTIGGDVHITQNSNLVGAGIDPDTVGLDETEFDLDIDGDTRENWDVGVDEVTP